MKPKKYPYITTTNILYKPLEIVDEKALTDVCTYKWHNQTLCNMNNSVVRLGVFKGRYHWHKHDNDDEIFHVVEGKLLVNLPNGTTELAPKKGIVVPKGVMHRTRAQSRTVVLMVETASIVPTGD